MHPQATRVANRRFGQGTSETVAETAGRPEHCEGVNDIGAEGAFGELQQQQLALAIEGLRPLDKILRLAVETSQTGEVSAIKLVELDDVGNPTGIYSIPLGAMRPSNVAILESKPVSLPPISLEPIDEDGGQQQAEKMANDRSAGS